MVDTTRLPNGMKGHLGVELAHDAAELEGVPGVKTAVLTQKVQHDGIAGGWAVVGKGIKKVEMVTVDGKIKV